MIEMMLDVDGIEANPFQPRMSEDAEHVRRLADSILQNDLMQIPMGRVIAENTPP
jgi:ParB-like chromosome segregation protein Spo0J